ncbi:MAG TPA: MmgE/PrpD family protein [Steroidobacteraceae bacterium]|jgi:2-methylcitrate dehydratase PrpD
MLNPALEVEDQTNAVSLIVALAEYAATFAIQSSTALETARHCLVAALAGAFAALRDPERAVLIGPLVPGALMPGGARVPGTSLELDPVQAAFCTGLMLCQPASGDHWLALRSGPAADSFGAVLPAADYQARKAIMEGKSPPRVRDMLAAMVKTLEIQGVLAADGIDDRPTAIRLARVASTAIVTAQLGGNLGQIVSALSFACAEGEMLLDADERHHAARSDWARADAISRAVRHACQAMAAGRPTYLTALDLETVDLAGKLLGARPSKPLKVFGTAISDRLATERQPQEAAQLTAGFRAAVEQYFPPRQAERIKALFAAPERLDDLPVNELLAAMVTNGAR